MGNSKNVTPFILINQFRKKVPKNVDLTDVKQSDFVLKMANACIDSYGLLEINEIENHLILNDLNTHVLILLALKLAHSKMLVHSIHQEVKVSVVFSMYKEHNRIKSKAEHPHGEDFLRRKVAQLNWLFSSKENFNWELIVVDDGCPEGSGKIAQQIIDEENLSDQVQVLSMQEAIELQLPTVVGMSSTNESQKGGGIAYGMWFAAQRNYEGSHIITFTDADLSTHLGQIGLLVDPLINAQKLVAIGSRREDKSVVIKQGTRNNRGKLFIYLWKRLIPELNEIIDTQCGFKAFRSEIVNEIIDDLIEKKFAFDIELLLKSELAHPGCIAKVAIAWIDSEAASTTTDIQPYLPMLKSIVNMYRKYLPGNVNSDEFAKLIEAIQIDDFNKMLDHIPAGILQREPIAYAEFDGVSAEALKSSYADR